MHTGCKERIAVKSSDPHKGGTEGRGTQTVPNKDFSRIKVCGVYLSFTNKGTSRNAR